MKTKLFKKLLTALALVTFAFSLAGCGGEDKKSDSKASSGLETWTSYEVGSGGYNQAAAIANALTQKYGTKIRIMPEGTSIGRMTTMKKGQAKFGFLADETFFATQAIYDFATKSTGPQDLRVILVKPSVLTQLTTKKSGIKTLYDLKGKRIAYIPGNSSQNVKNAALMAGADLTWDDVKKTPMASYTAALRALMEEKVDVVMGIPTASIAYEIENSPVGLDYVRYPHNDKVAWKKITDYAYWCVPGVEDRGAALTKGQPIEVGACVVPQIVCYSSVSDQDAYNMIKGLDETFELYKNLDPVAEDWELKKASNFPAGAPYHNGAIKYLKEKNLWTSEHEKKNQALLAEMKKIKDAWDIVLKEAEAKKISDKDFPSYWIQRRTDLTGLRRADPV